MALADRGAWRKAYTYGGGSGVDDFVARNAKRRAELDALLVPEEKEGTGVADFFKDGASSLLRGAGEALEYGARISRHGIREIAETARVRPNTEGLTAGEIFRSTDEADAAVKDMRQTVQGNGGLAAVLAERRGLPQSTVGAIGGAYDKALRPTGPLGKAFGAVDMAGMVASDPLNLVTFGAPAAARAAPTAGVRALGQSATKELAEQSVGKSLVPYSSDFADNQVADMLLNKAGAAAQAVTPPVSAAAPVAEHLGIKGSIFGKELFTVPGSKAAQAGIGKLGQTEAGKLLRKGFVPFAEVTDKFGKDVSGALAGIRKRGDAYTRLGTDDAMKAAGIPVDHPTREFVHDMWSKLSHENMVDDLAKLGDETGTPLVTRGADGKQVVDEVVADAIFNLSRKGADNEIVKHFDDGINWIKRWTLFNPVTTWGGRLQRDHLAGQTFNFARGVGPQDMARFHRVGGAVRKAFDSSEPFDQAIRKTLSGDDLEEGINLAREGILKPGLDLFEDLPANLTQKGSKVGNKILDPQMKAQELSEEHLRGSLFMKARRDGLSSAEASKLTDAVHLDYTPVGATRFERDYLKRASLFYTWLRRAPNAIVRTNLANPGKGAALNRAGLGFDDPDTEYNTFGEPLGEYVDTPMGFLGRLPNEFEGGPQEQVNPIFSAILNENKRGLTDILPPLGVAERTIGAGKAAVGAGNDKDQARLERLGLGTIFLRRGEDYAKEKWLNGYGDKGGALDRADAGKASQTDNLISAALAAGISQPYEMSDAELAQAILAAGGSRSQLMGILNP